MNNNRKREQPLHTYLNNNRRKQNMAQREQLTLCVEHKWINTSENTSENTTLKNLVFSRWMFILQQKNNYETTVSDKYYEFDGEIQHQVVSELQRRYMARR